MRDVLTRRTLAEAVDAILHPARASPYNWVLAHRDGGAANVEGSATSAGIDEPGDDGFLAHTNHYARDDMQGFERAGDYASSCARLDRARELARRASGFTVERLREALADHENGETRSAATATSPRRSRRSSGASPTSPPARSRTGAATPATPRPRSTGSR